MLRRTFLQIAIAPLIIKDVVPSHDRVKRFIHRKNLFKPEYLKRECQRFECDGEISTINYNKLPKDIIASTILFDGNIDIVNWEHSDFVTGEVRFSWSVVPIPEWRDLYYRLATKLLNMLDFEFEWVMLGISTSEKTFELLLGTASARTERWIRGWNINLSSAYKMH